MSSSQHQRDDKESPSNQSPAIFLLTTLGDTTWRMFLPTIGLAVVGYLVDQEQSTTPWLFLLGFAIGCIITGFLIKQQLGKKI